MTVAQRKSIVRHPSTIIIGSSMRLALNIAAGLCVLVGGVWFLQGINVLPGSFMTGQTKWAVYGANLLLIGGGLFIRANPRRA